MSRIGDCRSVLHATTVATNAVITRTGGPAALIATEGFRDVLEIARQIRHELYDLRTTKPVPLVPRPWALEVRERLRFDGSVIVPLDEDSVVARRRPASRLGHRVGRGRASSTPTSTRSTSERVAEILRDEVPGHLDLAFERHRARDPRVPTGQHDRRQRLRRAGRRRLHRSISAV